MILIIDNYDSFTHNLVQYVGELGFKIKVVRNDKISIKTIQEIKPSHIILSPGPGNPTESGISLDIIKICSKDIPILGVCLGHQSIAHAFGGQITKLLYPMHAKISKIYHNNKDIFFELPNPFLATRYHSLIINKEFLPKDIEITAETKEGVIMACQHKKYPLLRGLQFHPESLWTENGKNIIKNFLFHHC